MVSKATKVILGLCYVASMTTAFGAYALYLGHNNVVISGVFAALGGIGGIIAGYVVGKKSD